MFAIRVLYTGYFALQIYWFGLIIKGILKFCLVLIKTQPIYDEMTKQEKLEVSQVLTSSIHLRLVLPLYTYGCFYADGKPGTSWFTDD